MNSASLQSRSLYNECHLSPRWHNHIISNSKELHTTGFFKVAQSSQGAACHLARLLRRLPLVEADDELVDFAIEHSVDVPSLDTAAQVLHHLIRIQHVVSNLATK